MRNGNGLAKGISAILLAGVLAAGVLAAGVCCTGFASRDDNGKWFGNGNIATWHWSDKTDGKADDNTPDDEDNPVKPCVHEYAENSHTCTICGEVSAHEYAANSHTCTICGEVSAHEYAEGTHTCTICGEVSAHEYAENSHTCTICGEISAHEYAEDSQVCTVCGECKEHRYDDKGTCLDCGGRLIRYLFSGLSFEENTEFSKLTTNVFPENAKAGAEMEYVVSEPITAMTDEGIKYVYTVTEMTVSVSDQIAGIYDTVEVTQTETGWQFVVPEGVGTIEVSVRGTVEKELPQGYHLIRYTVQGIGASTMGGNWLIFGVPYAKEGDIVKAELVWNSTNTSTPQVPTINDLSVAYSSKNVTESHVIKGEYGASPIIFFTVGTGDVELVVEIS